MVAIYASNIKINKLKKTLLVITNYHSWTRVVVQLLLVNISQGDSSIIALCYVVTWRLPRKPK